MLFRSVKVVWMSGHTDRAVLEELTESNGTNFLAKPFTAAQLLATVRYALDAGPDETPSP